MAPTSPAVIFPNLEKYIQRSSPGGSQARKELPSSPSSVNPKGNKAKVEGVKDRVIKGKAVRRKSLIARREDSKSPSEQSTADKTYDSEMDIDEEWNEERGADIPELIVEEAISNVSGSDDVRSDQTRISEVASVNDKKTDAELEAVIQQTKLADRQPNAKLRPKRLRRKPNMLKELGSHNSDTTKVRKVSAPDGFDITEVHLTRGQSRLLDDISAQFETSPRRKLSAESLTALPSERTIESPPTLPSQRVNESPKTIPSNNEFRIPTTPPLEPDMARKQRKISKISDAKAWQLKKKKHGLTAWEAWQDRKNKITEMLETPHFSPSTTPNVGFNVGLVSSKPSDLSDLSEMSGMKELSEKTDRSKFLSSHFLIDLNDTDQATDTPKAFDFEVIDGVYVFQPTVASFVKFENFLETVEEIAGRKMGVVKVVVPKELLVSYNEVADHMDLSTDMDSPPYMDLSTENSIDPDLEPSISTGKPMLSLNPTWLGPRITQLHGQEIYDVRTMGGIRKLASEVVFEIRSFREALATHCAKHGELFADQEDIYKEVGFAATCGKEDDMISKYGQNESKDRYYGVNEVTKALQNALQCNRILLDEFHIQESGYHVESKKKERKPMFHVAGLFGSTLGLQMTDSAAYSLNVLHHGAPKYWTIIEPANHVKVEEQFHPDSENAGVRECRIQREEGARVGVLTPSERAEEKRIDELLEGRPCDLPPRCDQFMTHQPFYIPESTLSSFRFKFRKVVQHNGEMIITFPFAYYQVYATGNSLAEAIDYTNDRSEIFVKNNLWHNCHHDCTALRARDDWVDYMAGLEPRPTPTRQNRHFVPKSSFPHARSIFEADKTISVQQPEIAKERSIWDYSIA